MVDISGYSDSASFCNENLRFMELAKIERYSGIQHKPRFTFSAEFIKIIEC